MSNNKVSGLMSHRCGLEHKPIAAGCRYFMLCPYRLVKIKY